MGEFMEKLTNPVLDYLEVLERKDFNEMLALAEISSSLNLFNTILDNCENIDYDKFGNAVVHAFGNCNYYSDEHMLELIGRTDGHAERIIDFLISSRELEDAAKLVFKSNSKQMKERFGDYLLKSFNFNCSQYIVKLLKDENNADKVGLADHLASIGTDPDIASAIIDGIGFDKTNLIKKAIKDFPLMYWNSRVKEFLKNDVTYDMMADLLINSKGVPDIDKKILAFAKSFGGSKKLEDYLLTNNMFDMELLIDYAKASNADIERIGSHILKYCANNNMIVKFITEVPGLDLRKYIKEMIKKGDALAVLEIITHGANVGEAFTNKIILNVIALAIKDNQVHKFIYRVDKNKFIKKHQNILVDELVKNYRFQELVSAFKTDGLESDSYKKILDCINEKAEALEMVELYSKTSASRYNVWKEFDIASFIWTYADYHRTDLVYEILTKNKDHMTYNQKIKLYGLIVKGGDPNFICQLFDFLILDTDELKKLFENGCKQVCKSLSPKYIYDYAKMCEYQKRDNMYGLLTTALIKTGNIEYLTNLVKTIPLNDKCISKVEDYILSLKDRNIIVTFFQECLSKLNQDKFIKYILNSKMKIQDICMLIRTTSSKLNIVKLITDQESFETIIKYIFDNHIHVSTRNLKGLIAKTVEYKNFDSLLTLIYICKNVAFKNKIVVENFMNMIVLSAASFASPNELVKLFNMEMVDKIKLANIIINTGDIEAINKIAMDWDVRDKTNIEDVILASNNAEAIYDFYVEKYHRISKHKMEPGCNDRYARAILDTENAEYIAIFFNDARSKDMIKYAAELKQYADAIYQFRRDYRQLDNQISVSNLIYFIFSQNIDVFEAMYKGQTTDSKYVGDVLCMDSEPANELIDIVHKLDEYITNNNLEFNSDIDFIRTCRESGLIDKFVDILYKNYTIYAEYIFDTLIDKYYLEDEFVNGPQKIKKQTKGKGNGNK